MPSPKISLTSKNRQPVWANVLLAILSIISYAILFFEFNTSGNSFALEKNQFLVSIIFFLIMTLIIVITKRGQHQNEQILAETQQRYLNLLQQAADPVIVLNEFGIITSANAAVEPISLYRPDELIGRHFLKVNILTGNAIAIAAREFLQIIGGAKHPPFELTMLRKDKTPFVLEAHAQRIQNTDGTFLIHIIMRDITGRKNAEETLRQEKNKAQNYLNIAGVMLMSLDRTGKITMINKKGCEILETNESDIIGKNWFNTFVPFNESARMQATFDRMMTGDEDLQQNQESPIITHKGNIRLLSWKNSLLRHNNEILGTLSSGQDITEKQAFEDQLHLQSTALEAAANAIVITDKQGNIVWANQAFETMTGYTRKEALGQNPRVLKSGLQNEHYYENMWSTILAGNIWHGEIINRRKDNRLYTEEMTITPVRDKTGEIQHFIAIKHDITERKQLQQNLEQSNFELAANANKLNRTLQEMENKNKELQATQNQLIQSEKLAAIGVLSSGIAHEIKNPLAIISLSIEEFEAITDKLDNQSKIYIQMIKRAAERANNVIIELLRFARTSDLKVENVNLFDLISATITLVHNSSKFKGIMVQYECENKNTIVIGDRVLLEQVFFNLLINAVDSTERTGTVTVKTSQKEKFATATEQDQILIEIIDTGCGIPPANLSRIFEPFYTTKEQGKGTGLGLSTVYTLIKRHNGTIEVESTEGVGTKFSVTLPGVVPKT